MHQQDRSTPRSRGVEAPAHPDARVDAYIDWLVGVDSRDVSKGGQAAKRLRQLGISCCLMLPARPNGGAG